MADPKVLIVYFSRTGTTRRIATTLAALLDADLEAIFEYADRSGPFGYLRSLIEAVNRRSVSIVSTKRDTASYDVVIVGTPVWAGSVSSPVRAYLATNASRLPLVAFFLSYRGPGTDSAFAQLNALVGKTPLAQCKITAREALKGTSSRLLTEFASRVKRRFQETAATQWTA